MSDPTPPFYFDRQGKPITLEQWSGFYADWSYRCLQEIELASGVWIATIWIGHDALGVMAGPPYLFETTVFRRKGESPLVSLDQRQYQTEAEALAGHEEWVQKWKHDATMACLNCKKVTPHRFQPSPDAGPFWRCSECGAAQDRRPTDREISELLTSARREISELEKRVAVAEIRVQALAMAGWATLAQIKEDKPKFSEVTRGTVKEFAELLLSTGVIQKVLGKKGAENLQ